MHRFFVPPEVLTHDPVMLTGEPAHHIGRVLRMRPGDRVLLLDNAGWAYEVELTRFERNRVEGRIVRKAPAGGEPQTRITLYQALLKGHGFELVLQKGTEVGIAEFVPILCERCIMGGLADMEGRRQERWEKIIRGAAEQSHRGRLPILRPPAPFAQALPQAARADLCLLPWEEAHGLSLRGAIEAHSAAGGKPRSISLFIGPEGGLSAEEVQLARGAGIQPVTLGPRILRAETAGLVAAAAILYALGDLE